MSKAKDEKKYDYEHISEGDRRIRYRIRDKASDSALCSTYDEANARLIVRALNELGVDYMAYMRGVVRAESSKEDAEALLEKHGFKP